MDMYTCCVMNCDIYKYDTSQSDVEIPIPHYFTSENSKVLKERDKLLGTILAKKGPEDTEVS